MEGNIVEIGWMGSKMDKELMFLRMEPLVKEYGKMEKE